MSKKPFTRIGLVEWLKVKALSSSPSTEKKRGSSLGKEAGRELKKEQFQYSSGSAGVSGGYNEWPPILFTWALNVLK
jgi:hypothetical protein